MPTLYDMTRWEEESKENSRREASKKTIEQIAQALCPSKQTITLGIPQSRPAYKPATTTKCPSCGEEVSKNHKFCYHCGSQMQFICNDCKYPLNKDMHYCPCCGKVTIYGEHAELASED